MEEYQESSEGQGRLSQIISENVEKAKERQQQKSPTKSLPQNGLIKATTDYDSFKFRSDNRKSDRNHVENLMTSIMQGNDLHLHPIIVNEDKEVIDGQHRLMAARKLEVPIYYVVDEDFDPIKMVVFNTTQKRWATNDYLNYWCEQGREDYLKLREFVDDVGFSLTNTIRWMNAHGARQYVAFRKGAFKFRIDEKRLRGIMHSKKLMLYMKERNFKPTSIYNQSAFHEAMQKFFTDPVVDSDRFFQKLEISPFSLLQTRSWQSYIEQFADIYNYKMGKKSRIRVIKEGDGCEIVA